MSTELERKEEAIEDFLAMLLHGDIETKDRCAWRDDKGKVVEVTQEVHRRYYILRPEEKKDTTS